jgi:hypothetical protein
VSYPRTQVTFASLIAHSVYDLVGDHQADLVKRFLDNLNYSNENPSWATITSLIADLPTLEERSISVVVATVKEDGEIDDSTIDDPFEAVSAGVVEEVETFGWSVSNIREISLNTPPKADRPFWQITQLIESLLEEQKARNVARHSEVAKEGDSQKERVSSTPPPSLVSYSSTPEPKSQNRINAWNAEITRDNLTVRATYDSDFAERQARFQEEQQRAFFQPAALQRLEEQHVVAANTVFPGIFFEGPLYQSPFIYRNDEVRWDSGYQRPLSRGGAYIFGSCADFLAAFKGDRRTFDQEIEQCDRALVFLERDLKWCAKARSLEFRNINELSNYINDELDVAPTAGYLLEFVYSKNLEIIEYLIGCLLEVAARLKHTYDLDRECKLDALELQKRVCQEEFFYQRRAFYLPLKWDVTHS